LHSTEQISLSELEEKRLQYERKRSTPMNLFEDTNPRALKDLLAEIHNQTKALRDSQ
jgi:hypothetical protein